jgi:hypothetical protein
MEFPYGRRAAGPRPAAKPVGLVPAGDFSPGAQKAEKDFSFSASVFSGFAVVFLT